MSIQIAGAASLDGAAFLPYSSSADVKSRKGFWSSFRTGAAFRCLLTLVALFYVAQHVSVVAHFALVQHAVCDEHGELVDVDVASAAALASDVAPSSELSPREPSSHGHDHCSVLAHLRQQLTGAVFAGIPARVAAVPRVAIAPCPGVLPRAIPVYWLAPKNSPPV